ncbi:MAG: porin family protein [Rikenellaceae bacterium]
MKKSFLITLFLLFLPFVSYSQLSVGLTAGATHNTMVADAGYYERDYNARMGFAVAIPVEYQFNDWLAMRGEVGYIAKNYSWTREYGEFQQYTNSFVQVPLMANFSLKVKEVRLFLSAGGYLGYWAGSCISGQLLSLFDLQLNYFSGERYEFDSAADNRFDAGLLLGVGAKWNLCDKLSLLGELRMQYGLTDMQKPYMENHFPRYNTTIQLNIGVMYNFLKK